nr:hypothetical protein [Tanacetum cinerariifolium]
MGTFWEKLTEGIEGSFYLGPERPRVYSDLSPEEKERGQGNNACGAGVIGYGGAQNRLGNANPGQARQDVADDDDCDAFDYDIDEAHTAQTMLMANLSSTYPIYDEANSDDLDMHDDIQPNYIVDSHNDYANNSNMIPYD